MFGAQLGPLEIQMAADLVRLRKDMDQAKSVVQGAANAIEGTLGGLGRAFDMLGVGLSAAAFGKWIKGAIDAADEASKMAQKLGISTEKVAGLQLAFEQSGAGGADVMQKAMARLSDQLLTGNKTLEAMGIKTHDARQALGQIADQFAGMSDGSAKTTAAMDIFTTKLGANMIPLLNAGSEGLREMDELARKLGLTIDEETGQRAEMFNDTMDSLGQAMSGIARQASAQLLPTMNALAGAFLETFTEGGRLQGGIEVLSTGLKILTTAAAGAIEAFNTLGKLIGGVAAAGSLLLSGDRAGAAEALRAMAQDIGKGWEQTANTIKTAWSEAGSEVAAKSAEMARQQRLAAAAAAELEKKLLAQSEAAKKAAAEAKKLADAENDRISRRGLWELRRQDEAEAEAEKAAQALKDLESQRDLARLRRQDEAEAAADAVAQKEIEAMRKAQEQIQADWQKGVDQMAQSLTDALMDGGRNIAGYLRDMFRTLVLRPILAPVMGSVAGAISGPAAAAGGGAGGVGGLLDIGGLMGGLGTFGSAAGAGIGATLAGAGIGDLMAGAGAMIGQDTLAGLAGGAGLGLGAIAPYAAAAYGLYALGKKLFGKKLDDSGITGTFDTEGFTGQSYKHYERLIGGDSTKKKPLSSEMDAVLDAGAVAATATVKRYVEVLGLPVDAIEGFTKQIKLSLKGKNAEEIQQAIAGAVDSFGRSMADLFETVLEPFQKAGEDIYDTLQRLATLQSFSEELAKFGGVFGSIAGLAVDARESLIQMAGGMDALLSKSTAFVQNYYSRDEIAGVKAGDVLSTLRDAGITRDFGSTAEYRSYMEGLDLSTEAGRTQFTALLNASPDFADLAAFMGEDGTPNSLAGTASLAPESSPVAQLVTSSGNQLSAIHSLGFNLVNIADILERIEDLLDSPPKTTTTVVLRTPEVTVSDVWYDRN